MLLEVDRNGTVEVMTAGDGVHNQTNLTVPGNAGNGTFDLSPSGNGTTPGSSYDDSLAAFSERVLNTTNATASYTETDDLVF